MLWLRALRLRFFRPSRRIAFPSAHPDFGRASDDVLAVLLGLKRASFTPDTPDVREILKRNRHHHVRYGERAGERFVIVSREANTAEELHQLLGAPHAPADERGFRDDPDWHRRIGQLLGYPEEHIEHFVRRMQQHVPKKA